MKKFTLSCLAMLAALISHGSLAQTPTPVPTPVPAQNPTPPRLTPTAVTIPGSAPMLAPTPGAIAPPSSVPAGLHITVLDGAISLRNTSGATTFAAGQFGYVASNTSPPVLVPSNPGLPFPPPPSFTINKNVPSASRPVAAVDCEVR